MPGAAEAGDGFGFSLRFEDIDENGRADLAIGANGEDIGTMADAGAVWVPARDHLRTPTTSAVTSFNGSDFGLGGAGRQFGTVLR